MAPVHPMKEINPANPPLPLTPEALAEIAAMARRQRRANGVLMTAINYIGGQVEDGLKVLPKGARDRVEAATRVALAQCYAGASRSRSGRLDALVTTDRAHKILAAVSGAIGGLGGLPTALLELPVATMVIFRAVQGVAAHHGEDPASEETRLQCLQVFGAGGPGVADDGVDTSFIGARLGLSGAALNAMIARVAPRFAAVLGQKLAGQAVPVLGAVAGAGTNLAFTDYYAELAHVHFGLRRLARLHGEDAVLAAFHQTLVGKASGGS